MDRSKPGTSQELVIACDRTRPAANCRRNSSAGNWINLESSQDQASATVERRAKPRIRTSSKDRSADGRGSALISYFTRKNDFLVDRAKAASRVGMTAHHRYHSR